jgi:hypothetical protein
LLAFIFRPRYNEKQETQHIDTRKPNVHCICDFMDYLMNLSNNAVKGFITTFKSKRETMKKYIIIFFALVMTACTATVPKEVVELSYQMEKDLVQLQSTYIALVKQHVALLKKQREDYLNNEWAPKLIESWITDGQLIEMANGDVIYDEDSDEFRAVTELNRQQQLRGIVLWANVAVEEIEAKRKELIKPLEESEKKLIADINSSFSLIILGNQTISAHLNSIREVQDVQNELLKRAEWDGLRSSVSQKLSDLSTEANDGLKEIRKLDKQASEQMEKL